MMDDLYDLYQELIIDHNRNPRNFGALPQADRVLEGYNPLCGDKLTLYLQLDDDKISAAGFDGSGCAISVASASLMTDMIKGKSMDEAERLFQQFQDLLHSDQPIDLELHGKLSALAGVRSYPSRVKCATLCWHTLCGALQNETAPVSTE